MARLACQLMAVYTLISAVKALNYVIILPGSTPGEISASLIAAALLPFILLSVLAAFLWFRAESLAGHLAPDRELPTGRLEILGEDVQAVAFSLAGVLVLAGALPQLAQVVASLIQLYALPHYMRDSGFFIATIIPRAAGLLIQSIIGLWLTLGSRGVVVILKKIREAGLKSSDGD
jgi:hypothetical protein